MSVFGVPVDEEPTDAPGAGNVVRDTHSRTRGDTAPFLAGGGNNGGGGDVVVTGSENSLTAVGERASSGPGSLPKGHPFTWDWAAIIERAETGGDEQQPLTAVTALPADVLRSEIDTQPLRVLAPRVARFLVEVNLTALALVAAFSAVIAFRWLVMEHTGSRGDGPRADRKLDVHAYKLDARELMFWVSGGMMCGCVLMFPVIAWTAIYGFRRYGATLMAWAPSMFFGMIAYFVAYFLVFYRVFGQGFEVVTGQSSVIVFVTFVFTTAWTSKRAGLLSGEKRLPKLTSIAFIGLVLATFLYFFIIPRLWFADWMTDTGRVLIRLILHPLFFELANFAVRTLVRSVDIKAEPRRLFNLLLPGVVLNALYGRFLVAASSSTTVTIILALLLSGLEVFLRVSVGARDRLLYRITHSKEGDRLPVLDGAVRAAPRGPRRRRAGRRKRLDHRGDGARIYFRSLDRRLAGHPAARRDRLHAPARDRVCD
jgi:hypothetical protein